MNIEKFSSEPFEYYVATLVHNKLKDKYAYHKKKYYIKENNEWNPLDSEYLEFRKDFRNEINNIKQCLSDEIKKSEQLLKEIKDEELYVCNISVINNLSSIYKKLVTTTIYKHILAECKEVFYISNFK